MIGHNLRHAREHRRDVRQEVLADREMPLRNSFLGELKRRNVLRAGMRCRAVS